MPRVRPMLLLLFALLPPLLVGCRQDDASAAAEARRLGDYDLSAELYMRAALGATCPRKGDLLVSKAEALELGEAQTAAMEALNTAIRSCPEHRHALWSRAQRLAALGQRDAALEDLELIRRSHPDAAALFSELSMEAEAERAMRSRSHSKIVELRRLLDTEAAERRLTDRAGTQLARRVPVPATLKYRVEQSVRSPKEFSMEWEETLSFRGDPSSNDYLLVRSLEVPPLPSDLPTYFRLQMANQRLPMRFDVDGRGKVTDARWLRNGPERGVRPSMLAPEIEAALKRRRLFEPGGDGLRGPGDRWRGEDTRIVDARPVELEYTAEALGWVELQGIRTLHLRFSLKGEGYSAEEELWIHPSTAVPVRRITKARYDVQGHRGSGVDRWDETRRASLISISGVN